MLDIDKWLEKFQMENVKIIFHKSILNDNMMKFLNKSYLTIIDNNNYLYVTGLYKDVKNVAKLLENKESYFEIPCNEAVKIILLIENYIKIKYAPHFDNEDVDSSISAYLAQSMKNNENSVKDPIQIIFKGIDFKLCTCEKNKKLALEFVCNIDQFENRLKQYLGNIKIYDMQFYNKSFIYFNDELTICYNSKINNHFQKHNLILPGTSKRVSSNTNENKLNYDGESNYGKFNNSKVVKDNCNKSSNTNENKLNYDNNDDEYIYGESNNGKFVKDNCNNNKNNHICDNYRDNQSGDNIQDSKSCNNNRDNQSSDNKQDYQSDNNRGNQSDDNNQDSKSCNKNQDNQSCDSNQDNLSGYNNQDNQSFDNKQDNKSWYYNRDSKSWEYNQDNKSWYYNRDSKSWDNNRNNKSWYYNRDNKSWDNNQDNKSYDDKHNNQNQNEANNDSRSDILNETDNHQRTAGKREQIDLFDPIEHQNNGTQEIFQQYNFQINNEQKANQIESDYFMQIELRQDNTSQNSNYTNLTNNKNENSSNYQEHKQYAFQETVQRIDGGFVNNNSIDNSKLAKPSLMKHEDSPVTSANIDNESNIFEIKSREHSTMNEEKLETIHLYEPKMDNLDNNKKINTTRFIIIDRNMYEYILESHFEEYSNICSICGCNGVYLDDNDGLMKMKFSGTNELINKTVERFTCLFQKVQNESSRNNIIDEENSETNHLNKLNIDNNENTETDSIKIEKKTHEYILKWYFQEYSEICSTSGCKGVITEDNGNVVKILVSGTKEIVNNALEDFTNLIQKVDKEEIKEEFFELKDYLMNAAECVKCIQDSVFVKNITVNFVGTEKQKQDFIAKIKEIRKQPAFNTASVTDTASFTLTEQTINNKVNLKTPLICAEKLLDSGLKVYIAKGNLVEQRTEAIVNPANNHLKHGGGAAKAISKAAGSLLKKESDESISKDGELKVAEVRHTTAGNMGVNGVKYVLHVVGPRYSDYVDKNKMREDLKMAFYKCFDYANTTCKIGSISIPAISSGIYGVEKKDVAIQMMLALDHYSKSYSSLSESEKHLKDIYFINNDDKTVEIIHKEFINYLSGELYNKTATNSSSWFNTSNFSFKIPFTNYSTSLKSSPVDKKNVDKPNFNFFSLIPDTHLEEVLHAIKFEMEKNSTHYKSIYKNFNNVTKLFKNFHKNLFNNINKYETFYITTKNIDLFSQVASNALKRKITLKNETENLQKKFTPTTDLNEAITIIYTPIDSEKLGFAVMLNSSNKYNYNNISNPNNPTNENNGFVIVSSDKSITVDQQPAPDYKKGENKNKSSHTSNNSNPSVSNNADSSAHASKSNKSTNVNSSTSVYENKGQKNIGKETKDKVKDANNIEKEECAICMDDILDPEELPCKHRFCRECLTQFKLKCVHACPACKIPFGEIFGDMPDGKISWEVQQYVRLEGFKEVDTIKMSFYFPDGIQQENHPNPGQPYKGTYREAYLPNNKEGQKIMHMIKKAFDNKVLFTIGRSNTTGHNNVVTFNDIHLKTSLTGQFGYPDSGYFDRVKSELASKGIQPSRHH